jgi:4-amino-4-deoxy-L-arabinose transferase-like glycosyltransferase
MKRIGHEFPAWLPAWLVLAGVSIFLHGPLPLYSTRTLAVAWEMYDGAHWLLPWLNGAAYSHKAPLLYWLIHAGWLAGGVSDTWPRVLQVLIGALALALTALLAQRLFPRRVAPVRFAPWLLAGTAFFFLYALQLMFDVLLAACVLGALAALVRGGPAHPRPAWGAFAVWVAAGLLTKGPVALLHVAFPLLLAPWWNAAARRDRTGWYARATLALLAALALFALWVVPAAWLGGPEYRAELLWTQTAGRVVDSFDHAEYVWWYLLALPVIGFPWLLWPGAWSAIAAVNWRNEPGLRLLFAWLLPTFVAFSLISGKQAYYLVPELAGGAVLLAYAFGRASERDGHHGRAGVRAWVPALLLVAIGAGLAALPWLVQREGWDDPWLRDLARSRHPWGLGIVACGLALFAAARNRVAMAGRVAIATLVASALAHVQFTDALWRDYDVAPTAQRVAQAQAEGRPVANVGVYEGQFTFAGRLRAPVESVLWPGVPAWVREHPEGVVVQYPSQPTANTAAAPQFAQPLRGSWIEVWTARDWALAHPHLEPPDPGEPQLD